MSRFVRLQSRGRLSDLEIGQVRRAALLDEEGEPVDDILVSCEPAPDGPAFHLHLHGGVWLVERTVERLQRAGLTHLDAAPSTVWPAATRIESEAWRLLPSMRTRRGADWLLAQVASLSDAMQRLLCNDDNEAVCAECRRIAERGGRARWFVEDVRFAVLGPPNAGKSTLVNLLAGRPASLVSERPGTTRDVVEAAGEVGGFPAIWLDTAGLRETEDPLEQEGMRRARERAAAADLALVMLDVADPPEATALAALLAALPRRVVALNKADLGAPLMEACAARVPAGLRDEVVPLAARDGRGIEALERAILAALGRAPADFDAPAAFSAALAELFSRAAAARPAARADVLGPLLAPPNSEP